MEMMAKFGILIMLLIFCFINSVDVLHVLSLREMKNKWVIEGNDGVHGEQYRFKRSPDPNPYPIPIPKGGKNTIKIPSSNATEKDIETIKVGPVGAAFSIIAAIILLALMIILIYRYWKD